MIDRRTLVGSLLLLALAPGALAAQRGSPDDAKEMVASAIALYRAEGSAAFAVMNRGAATGFMRGDLYVFAFDARAGGRTVVQPFNPARIGLLVDDIRDANGKPFGREMRERATPAGAWVDYIFMDPITRRNQAKSSWVVRYGDYVFGCGIYKPGSDK